MSLRTEVNDLLTQTDRGTPMGELMRRYWHPISASIEVNEENPTKEVRLLGEDLVLFRSASGEIGLIEPSCPHRKANLSYGVPEPEGIRCAYHGWLFDVNGNCVDQPSEPVGSRFKDKVKLKAYPVEELGGVIFAIELILTEFRTRSFIPLVVASVIATAVARTLKGDLTAFDSLPAYSLRSPLEYLLYLVLGVVAGLAATGFIKLLFSVDRLASLTEDDVEDRYRGLTALTQFQPLAAGERLPWRNSN